MTAAVIVLVVIHYAVLAFQIRMDDGRYGHAVTFYCLGFFGFYLFRPTLFVLDLDTPLLDPLGPTADAGLVEDSLVLLLVWQLLVVAGVALTHGRQLGPGAVGAIPDRHLVGFGGVVLSGLGLATLASVALLVQRSGGLTATIATSKLDRGLAGLFILEVFPIAGTLLAARMAIEASGRRRTVGLMVVAATFAGAGIFWGSRRVIIVLAATVAVWLLRRADTGRLSAARLIPALAMATTVPVGAVALRIFRDNAVGGGSAGFIQQEAPIRQISRSLNTSYYEAFALIVRDFPDDVAYWGARPFLNGFLGPVPRALWPGKPTDVVVGAEFRQVYEPLVQNGWPVGAAGDWLLTFGPVGLVVGGLVSGAALGLVGRALARHGSLPYAAAFGLQVLELGFHTQSVTRWFIWIVPAMAIGFALRQLAATTASRPVIESGPAELGATGHELLERGPVERGPVERGPVGSVGVRP